MRSDDLYYYAARRDLRIRYDFAAARMLPFVMSLLRDGVVFESLEDPHAHQKNRLPISRLPLFERVVVRYVLQELAELIRKCITCSHDWHPLLIGIVISVHPLRAEIMPQKPHLARL